SEVKDVAVVEGTPAVPVLPDSSSEERYGAAWPCRASSSAPSPSTRKTTYDGASGRTSPRSTSSRGRPSARDTAGRTSASERSPYAGSENSADDPAPDDPAPDRPVLTRASAPTARRRTRGARRPRPPPRPPRRR